MLVPRHFFDKPIIAIGASLTWILARHQTPKYKPS